jgi:hypothetical protein
MAKQYQQPKAPDQTGDDVATGESTPPDEAVVDTTKSAILADVPKKVNEKPVRPTKITSHEEAVEYVLNFFDVPAGVKTIWVCEDTNIFYRGNPAEVHAKEQNIKLFSIQWD